jgi:hypothetical protein
MRIIDSTAFSFNVGSEPGSPKHTGQTFVFGSDPKLVGQAQNTFVAVFNSTCTSKPKVGSNLVSASSKLKLVIIAELYLKVVLPNGLTALLLMHHQLDTSDHLASLET